MRGKGDGCRGRVTAGELMPSELYHQGGMRIVGSNAIEGLVKMKQLFFFFCFGARGRLKNQGMPNSF